MDVDVDWCLHCECRCFTARNNPYCSSVCRSVANGAIDDHGCDDADDDVAPDPHANSAKILAWLAGIDTDPLEQDPLPPPRPLSRPALLKRTDPRPIPTLAISMSSPTPAMQQPSHPHPSPAQHLAALHARHSDSHSSSARYLPAQSHTAPLEEPSFRAPAPPQTLTYDLSHSHPHIQPSFRSSPTSCPFPSTRRRRSAPQLGLPSSPSDVSNDSSPAHSPFPSPSPFHPLESAASSCTAATTICSKTGTPVLGSDVSVLSALATALKVWMGRGDESGDACVESGSGEKTECGDGDVEFSNDGTWVILRHASRPAGALVGQFEIADKPGTRKSEDSNGTERMAERRTREWVKASVYRSGKLGGRPRAQTEPRHQLPAKLPPSLRRRASKFYLQPQPQRQAQTSLPSQPSTLPPQPTPIPPESSPSGARMRPASGSASGSGKASASASASASTSRPIRFPTCRARMSGDLEFALQRHDEGVDEDERRREAAHGYGYDDEDHDENGIYVRSSYRRDDVDRARWTASRIHARRRPSRPRSPSPSRRHSLSPPRSPSRSPPRIHPPPHTPLDAPPRKFDGDGDEQDAQTPCDCDYPCNYHSQSHAVHVVRGRRASRRVEVA